MNILISLEKQYFDQIKEGVKKYEYRRKFVRKSCRAYLYIAKPQMEIMGYVDLEKPIIATPKELGDFAERQVTGIGKEIEEYMFGLAVGYAAKIKRFTEIEPVPLMYLRNSFNFTAPQGYIILDKRPELLRLLEKRSVVSTYGL